MDIGESSRAIGADIEFLEDPSGKLTITDVISPSYSGRFIRTNRTPTDFGLGETVYWLRLSLADQSPVPGNWLLEQPFPLMRSFDLYIPALNGLYVVHHYFGSPDLPRPVLPHRNPYFFLPISKRPTTFYIRASVGSILTFPLVVQNSDYFLKQNALSLLCYGLYFGILVTVALYNLHLSLVFRERVYLYFIAYIILFAVLQMSLHGFLRQYLFPDSAQLDNQVMRFLIIGASIASILFSRRFLDTRRLAPFMDLCLLAVIGFDVALLAIVPFLSVLSALTVLNAHTLIVPIIATAAGIACYRNGFKAARYYLAARFCFYASLCIFALNNIFFHTHNFISWYGMMIGSLLEVVFLSRALADRISDTLREKEQVESEMIRSSGRALVGEMAAGVAHEVNNPLAGVMLCFKEILVTKEGDPERDELIAAVQDGLTRIRDTVARLLDFSRMSFTEIRPIDLHVLIDNILKLCSYQLQKDKIEVRKQLDMDPPLLPLDEMKMGQVLVNLILNAQHAMPDGGTLTIRTEQSGNWCDLSITDSGIGIQPEIMPKIFEPFFSTRSSGKGTGLGLSVCKNIVEAHGGTIAAESTPGEGTCFRLRLPYKERVGT